MENKLEWKVRRVKYEEITAFVLIWYARRQTTAYYFPSEGGVGKNI